MLLQSRERGQAVKGESRCVAALSKHLQEFGECVFVCWEVFVSQLITGSTHRQTPNSKDLICITVSICTHAPSFQQHPWGQTVAAWNCLLPDLLALRTGLFSMLQPLIYYQKSLVLKRQLDTGKLNQFSPVESCVSGRGNAGKELCPAGVRGRKRA